jgi:hypothetical protein
MWLIEPVNSRLFLRSVTVHVTALVTVRTGTILSCIWDGCLGLLNVMFGARGGVVVEALRYKPEGRGFDSRWCYWIILLT